MVQPLFQTPETSQHNFQYEQQLRGHGFKAIAGSDEVGRGPLAGPVVAASVILPQGCEPHLFLDSKKLNEKKREELAQLLITIGAQIGIGVVSEREIDKLNILQASLLAMKISVEDLANKGSSPDYVLVDGKFIIPHPLPQQALIKGETKSASIAAASIIAKVTRDRIMGELHERYPQYNFLQHKGYPTKAHRQALARFGPSPVHRRSFKGVVQHVS